MRTLGTVVGLLALGIGLFFLAKGLVAGDADTGEEAARTSAAAPTSRSVEECVAAPLPSGLEMLEPLVAAIHDAACRGDADALLPHMTDPFGSLQVHKEWAIDLWSADVPGGDPLALLAETLEAPAHGGQGGQFFCHPDGPVVVFARPIGDQPVLMSDFDLTGRELSDLCGGTP